MANPYFATGLLLVGLVVFAHSQFQVSPFLLSLILRDMLHAILLSDIFSRVVFTLSPFGTSPRKGMPSGSMPERNTGACSLVIAPAFIQKVNANNLSRAFVNFRISTHIFLHFDQVDFYNVYWSYKTVLICTKTKPPWSIKKQLIPTGRHRLIFRAWSLNEEIQVHRIVGGCRTSFATCKPFIRFNWTTSRYQHQVPWLKFGHSQSAFARGNIWIELCTRQWYLTSMIDRLEFAADLADWLIV